MEVRRLWLGRTVLMWWGCNLESILYKTHRACNSPVWVVNQTPPPTLKNMSTSNIRASDFIQWREWNSDLLEKPLRGLPVWQWQWTSSAASNPFWCSALTRSDKHIPQRPFCLICILILSKENGKRSRSTWKRALWNIDWDDKIFKF